MSESRFLSPDARRQRNHDEMVEAILAIAREMMRAEGVAALSFNAIARRLGMKPPSLYTYFDSKHAIYDLLFRRGFEEFSHLMKQRPHRGDALAKDLQSVIETFMGFALDNLDLYQLMFQRPIPGFVPSDKSMAVSLAALQQGRDDLAQIVTRGEIDPQLPADTASDLIISLMYGLTEQQMANNPELPVGQGRFGSLIPDAVTLFLKAWKIEGK